MVTEMSHCDAVRVDFKGDLWVRVKLDRSRAGKGVDRDGDYESVWLTPDEARKLGDDLQKAVS